ncbi:hypothetical protein, partial [Saccharicrinis fermentans]|uniref:hypothetical protein n=1 Tax=Saccharicrinis fermentans TaxID=982 RepID=UPI0005C5B784
RVVEVGKDFSLLDWRAGKVVEWLSCISHLIDIFHSYMKLSVKDHRAGQNNSLGAGAGERLPWAHLRW